MTAKLTNDEILRYGRQLILPNLGIHGQTQLKNSSALIVGTGGLGAPSSMYLAAAGIGTLGLVDFDVVDKTNLHRQVIHAEEAQDLPKVMSARQSLQRLNSHVKYVEHNCLISASNALEIVAPYDIVLDCSDNVATRYLLNDACVLLGKPLVSGSALRLEGQLTVYNHANGPCYRCLFPTPPPAETVTNCSDGGVMGPVTGTIGSMQAMEAIKILAMRDAADSESPTPTYSGRMLLMDAWMGTFRTIRLRPKQKTCAACGDKPTVTELIDYVQFCGSGALDKAKPLKVLAADERIDVHAFAQRVGTPSAVVGGESMLPGNEPPTLADSPAPVILDVREKVQFDIAHLPSSVNIPYAQLGKRVAEIRELVQPSRPLLVLCRRGNHSQLAVRDLKQQHGIECVDVIGGLEEWHWKVDPTFPLY
ncbi:hypothetical protein BCR44DRAFT_54365 [Catenaria anguillulae PL171]|uniref:Rhodanese domain-containing protein n=1 Tax=Catenaria anguillulae PL171 TaxID=765915 RepID=A0A1Y2HGQ1_9FUNG|nr:hypothetical protein BCR44DRAFT_54365 [Catenaria anguillulae PL171]